MTEQPEGQKYILNLYAAFGVSLILSVLPYMSAAILSLVFFLGVLVGSYAVRKKVDEHSLAENHATYIIRTLWISAFISLVTTGLATAYMLGGIDYSTFQPCANKLANNGVEWMENASMMAVYTLMQPCLDNFLGSNKTLLTNAVIIAGGPIVVYMAYRMVKGLSRAMKGYRLSNPKSWI